MLGDAFREEMEAYVCEEWGGPLIVSRGHGFDTRGLPGFVAVCDGKMAGGILLRPEGREVEIAVLFSLVKRRGIGTALLDAAVRWAREQGMQRVWLVTTNDNAHAFRFYQRYGLSLVAVHWNAMQRTREIKPMVPERGIDDIPLLHEMEFAMDL